MKAYEVFITRLTENGWFDRRERIALTLNREKVDEIIKAFRKEKEIGTFWMTYQTKKVEDKKEIEFEVEEVEVV